VKHLPNTHSTPLLPLSSSEENNFNRQEDIINIEDASFLGPKRNQKSTHKLSKTQIISSEPVLKEETHPVANKASYGLLMDVVVGTSKKFLEASKELDSRHCLSSLKVIATHSKRKNGLEGVLDTSTTGIIILQITVHMF